MPPGGFPLFGCFLGLPNIKTLFSKASMLALAINVTQVQLCHEITVDLAVGHACGQFCLFDSAGILS